MTSRRGACVAIACVAAAGGLAVSGAAVLVSDGPGDYGSNWDCRWIVELNRTAPNSFLLLNFSSIDLYDSDSGDYVEVIEGTSTSGDRLFKLTGADTEDVLLSCTARFLWAW